MLDENDEIAALEAIRVALTEVGDGGTYVWHRQHGRLSGIVQPTTSFKDPGGRVCRHIVLIMTVGAATGKRRRHRLPPRRRALAARRLSACSATAPALTCETPRVARPARAWPYVRHPARLARAAGSDRTCRGYGPSSRSPPPAARCCATPCRRS